MGLETIMETVNSELFGVWFLIGAVLVFFMQCGFAMVETGFTRAKNAGNIIMKNLMDFCIGTVMFILLGYGLMCGQDYIAGVIGLPNLGIFTHYNDFNWSNFVFNLVFCATAATIVSSSDLRCGVSHRGRLGLECGRQRLAAKAGFPRLRRILRHSHGGRYRSTDRRHLSRSPDR